MAYITALSDVYEALEQYRKDHSGMTTDQGDTLRDVMEIVTDLADGEYRRMDKWFEDNDKRYGGAE